MSLKHGLLGLINYKPVTGYELDRTFKDSLYFFWQANTSQIYRELNAMEKRGWLTSTRVIQTDRPNKRVYSITEEGRKELIDWLQNPNDDIYASLHVKNPLLVRIFFSGEISKEHTIELLREYQEECTKCLLHLNKAHEAIEHYGEIVDKDHRTKYWEMTALFGEFFYEAGLKWAEKVIPMLEEMEQGELTIK